MTASTLVENFFRHEYGRLVAMLSCRIGVEHIEDIEDAVQAALMKALEHWTISGVPDNPSAWLFRVAHNNTLNQLRNQSRRLRLLRENVRPEPNPRDEVLPGFPGEIQDSQLRLLFACCDEAIPIASQLVFALKTLCGFDVREIAVRLFTTEANTYKRLARARDRLKEGDANFGELSSEECSQRISSVRKVLYLLFTEGHLSSNVEMAIRRELCNEAIRLTTLLAEHSVGESPETFALLALMHLHAARISARNDGAGGLLLLEEQDRSLWDQDSICEGLIWLGKSAEGDVFSRFHAEAGIAAEHCLAPSFTETRWDRISECYELLERTTTSPLHRLNRAVAVAEWKGPEVGLAILEGFEPPPWLVGSYLWSAVLADLHGRCGNQSMAAQFERTALDSAPSTHVAELLKRRLAARQKM